MTLNQQSEKVDLSVIVPLYNEAESIEKLYDAISRSAAAAAKSYEIIFVDDGSKDATFSVAKKLAETDKCLKVIKFRANAGQTPAMVAGIDYAFGDVLITMDGDLQNDPSDIPGYLEKMNDGFDIVCGIRQKRQDKLFTRKIPSKIANWLIGKITGVPIRDNGCALRAYRAKVVKSVPLYSEMHRFIPAMMSLTKAKIIEIPVKHHARQFGVSKYGLSRIYKVLLDLLTVKAIITYIRYPLVIFFLAAAICFLVGTIPLIFLVFAVIFSLPYSLVICIAFSQVFWILTFSLLCYGIIADFVYKTGNYKIESLPKILLKNYE